MRKKIQQKLQVTIGIPAFNEEKNIRQLLQSLVAQDQSTFTIREIIVASDASTDNTVPIVRRFPDSRITVINGTKRVGQLVRIGEIVRVAKGDIIILCDGDIGLDSNRTLAHLIAPFYTRDNIGIVSAARKPLPSPSLIAKAIHTSIRAYNNIGRELRGGNNPFNCHGALLALSGSFAKSAQYPKVIFSGDTFLYFQCLANGYSFRFAPDAITWFKTAETLKDAIAQYSRFLDIDDLSIKKFGTLIQREYNVPITLRIKYLIAEFLSYPFPSLCMYSLKLYCRYVSKRSRRTKAAWQIAGSTKVELAITR